MRDAIKGYVDAAQSLIEIPRDRAERIARRLAGNGMIDPGQIRSVASDLVERSRENRRKITEMVASEIRRQVSRIGFASKDDVERLRQRVQALEANQRTVRKTTTKPGIRAKAKPAARKSAPKAKPRARRKPASKR